ncbi:MAG TPA: ABC transporter permease, partial [Longimicrobiales bacterium]|nr:ABC transporter permease [Longimicrobiales bacterium]
MVTGRWFPMQGIGAEVGRTILPEDDVTPGAHPVVMLGYDYWRTVWGGDPDVVGRELRIAGRPYTVVGVADRRYTGTVRGLSPELILPVSMVNELMESGYDELSERGNQSSFGRARLAPGTSLAEAEAALERVAGRLRAEHPDQWFEAKSFRMVPTEEIVVHPMMDGILVPAFATLLGVVGVVLLIACANLASFLLAQAADRRKEIAVRLAVGASRGALLRQLLTETVLLAVVGGGLGLVLAAWTMQAVLAADLPLPLPVTLDVSPDATVLAFTAAVSLAAGLLFGLVPGLQATRPDLSGTLKDEGTGGGRPRRISLRGALVSAQVALSLTLLVTAGLLLRSFLARQSVDPGFGAEPSAILALQVPAEGYGTDDELRVWWEELERRLLLRPEVEAVGLTSNVHLNTLSSSSVAVEVEGVEPPPGRRTHAVSRARTDDGYFDAAGIELVTGRVFDASDVADAPPVVVVNRAFGERFWPDDGPNGWVGRTFRADGAEVTVAGVVETVKIRNLGEAPTPFVYQAMSQAWPVYA